MSADRALVVLAARQHGHVTTAQLVSAGLSRRAIAHRVSIGWLERRHRGVYRVGPVRSPQGELMAAILAYGQGTLLSHRSAAVRWELLPSRPGPVHVTVRGRGTHNRPGIRVHHAELYPGDATQRHGIPLTSPARTLLDLATTAKPRELARATEQAQVLRLVTERSLKAQFERYPRHQGAKALQQATAQDPALTRSEAERRLLDLIRSARLPAPQTNVRLAGHEVDVFWPEAGLVVEVDGFAFHSSRAAFERDRRRDRELLAHGYRVLRVTWRQLEEEPAALVASLARARAAP